MGALDVPTGGTTTRRAPLRVGLSVVKVREALAAVGGSTRAAARLLGVTRNTILYWRDRDAA